MKRHFLLWAEDDPDDIALYRRIVEELDSKTLLFSANDGREVMACLSLLRKEKIFPCLVVLDMNMPALGGRETIALIKKEPEFAHIPIVVFSTSGSQADRNFCRRFGVELFTKPPSLDALKATITEMLHRCSCPRQQASAPNEGAAE